MGILAITLWALLSFGEVTSPGAVSIQVAPSGSLQVAAEPARKADQDQPRRIDPVASTASVAIRLKLAQELSVAAFGGAELFFADLDHDGRPEVLADHFEYVRQPDQACQMRQLAEHWEAVVQELEKSDERWSSELLE